jgi:hypothetical protein
VVSGQVDLVPVEAAHETVQPAAQTHRTAHDRVEDRLYVGRRAADDFQDFTRRRLLLEGFGHLGMSVGQRLVLFLELREQTHVLDGDRGLVGERFHEGDVAVGEGPDFPPVDGDHAQQLGGAKHRHRQHRAQALDLSRAIGVFGVCFHIVDVNGAPFEDDPPRGAIPSGRNGIVPQECRELGRDVVGGHSARKTPPSKPQMNARSASHSLTAFSARASKTGWRSKVDRR